MVVRRGPVVRAPKPKPRSRPRRRRRSTGKSSRISCTIPSLCPGTSLRPGCSQVSGLGAEPGGCQGESDRIGEPLGFLWKLVHSAGKGLRACGVGGRQHEAQRLLSCASSCRGHVGCLLWEPGTAAQRAGTGPSSVRHSLPGSRERIRVSL